MPPHAARNPAPPTPQNSSKRSRRSSGVAASALAGLPPKPMPGPLIMAMYPGYIFQKSSMSLSVSGVLLAGTL